MLWDLVWWAVGEDHPEPMLPTQESHHELKETIDHDSLVNLSENVPDWCKTWIGDPETRRCSIERSHEQNPDNTGAHPSMSGEESNCETSGWLTQTEREAATHVLYNNCWRIVRSVMRIVTRANIPASRSAARNPKKERKNGRRHKHQPQQQSRS